MVGGSLHGGGQMTDIVRLQVLEIILSGLALGAILVFVEALKRKDRIHAEAARKSIHISVGLLLGSLPLFMDRWQIVLTNLGFFLGVLLLAGMLHIFTAVHAVKRWTIGEFLYPLSIGMIALVYPDLRVYTFAVFMLAFGDGLAGLIGRAFGGRGYEILGGRKTILGNLTFFSVAVLLMVAFWSVTHPADPLPWFMLLASSALLTVAEAIIGYGFDNIAVPFSAAWVATLILTL